MTEHTSILKLPVLLLSLKFHRRSLQKIPCLSHLIEKLQSNLVHSNLPVVLNFPHGACSLRSRHDEQNKTIQIGLCDFVCLVLRTSNKESTEMFILPVMESRDLMWWWIHVHCH